MYHPEKRAPVNVHEVVLNHAGLILIVATVRVFVLLCTCVLTYSFTHYNSLKRDVEALRQYVVSPSVVVGRQSDGSTLAATVGGVRMGEASPTTSAVLAAAVAANGTKATMNTQRGAPGHVTDVTAVGRNANGRYPAVVKQEASDPGTSRRHSNVMPRGGVNGAESAAVSASSTTNTAAAYSNMATATSDHM